MRETMLTTIDNPYDPFEQFEDWYAFDEQKGYNTCSFLARLAATSIDLPNKTNQIVIERAIDDIVKSNFLGLYRKVTRETSDK